MDVLKFTAKERSDDLVFVLIDLIFKEVFVLTDQIVHHLLISKVTIHREASSTKSLEIEIVRVLLLLRNLMHH